MIFLKNLTIILVFSLSSSFLGQALAADTQKNASVESSLALTPPKEIIEGMAANYLAGRYARGQGDYDAAIHFLTRTLKQSPGNADFASQLLSMYVMKGQMSQALATAESLEKNAHDDPLAKLLLLTQKIQKGDYQAASDYLALSFDPANGQLWLPLVDAWLDVGLKRMTKPLTVEELPITVGRASSIINYHLALVNAQAGYKDAATANFIESIKSADNSPARILQGVRNFYKNNGQPAALKPYIGSAEDEVANAESPVLTPNDGVAEVLYTMGSVMQIAGIRNDAIIYLQLARMLRPDFYLSILTLAEVYADSEQYALSMSTAEAIPATSKYFMSARLLQVMNLNAQGKQDEALKSLAALAAKKPAAVEPWVSKADMLRKDKRFLEATIAYSEAIKRIAAPGASHWPLYYSRGASFDQLGRWNEAKDDFEKALALSPNQPDVLNYYGYSLLMRGEKIETAKTMLQKAVQLRPNDPHIIDSLGWAFYLLGDYATALPYIEQAVELMPGDATVNDHLGDVYYRLGRKNEARFQWQRALTFKPDAKEAAEINQKLMSGLPAATTATKSSAAVQIPAAPPVP